jgi:hypothetical protein
MHDKVLLGVVQVSKLPVWPACISVKDRGMDDHPILLMKLEKSISVGSFHPVRGCRVLPSLMTRTMMDPLIGYWAVHPLVGALGYLEGHEPEILYTFRKFFS